MMTCQPTSHTDMVCPGKSLIDLIGLSWRTAKPNTWSTIISYTMMTSMPVSTLEVRMPGDG